MKHFIRFFLSFAMFVLMTLVVYKFCSGYSVGDNEMEGQGTKNDPYLVSCVDDLIYLRDKVNSGDKFESVYFLQICDIDLENVLWEPIGIAGTGRYFFGVYDGGGHSIKNINIPAELNVSCPGMFGQLGGQVVNLGIESGYIEGDFAGSIASHSIGEKAAIINCWNNATIVGKKRAGGICDNFSGGSIINCANLSSVQAPISGNIVSYSAKNLINVYNCLDMYNEFFSGSYIQLNESSDYEDFILFLNDGIQKINEYKMFEYGYLKLWDR